MIKLVVNGQNLYRYSTGEILADDSVDFIEFEFEFSSEWEGMEKTAQFIQGEKVYSVILVDNKCYLPTEITEGSFFITVFGYAGERRVLLAFNGFGLALENSKIVFRAVTV